jgi:hypothetical protein
MSSQTLEKAKKIVEKVKRKYYTQYQNAVVVLNPEHSSWRPLVKGVKYRPVFKELMKTAAKNPGKYNQTYRVLVQVFARTEKGEIAVNCNFAYFTKGKERSTMSFGRVIRFTPEQVLNIPFNNSTIHEIVKIMNKKGKASFSSLRAVTYDDLFS